MSRGNGGRLCADWNAAGKNVEVSVPAVSMACRRIERLQGVQFCRRTMEIRSEVSGPPDLFHAASLENWNVSSLLFSGFGRAGATDERVLRIFSCLLRSVSSEQPIRTPIFGKRVRLRWAPPKPAKEP